MEIKSQSIGGCSRGERRWRYIYKKDVSTHDRCKEYASWWNRAVTFSLFLSLLVKCQLWHGGVKIHSSDPLRNSVLNLRCNMIQLTQRFGIRNMSRKSSTSLLLAINLWEEYWSRRTNNLSPSVSPFSSVFICNCFEYWTSQVRGEVPLSPLHPFTPDSLWHSSRPWCQLHMSVFRLWATMRPCSPQTARETAESSHAE